MAKKGLIKRLENGDALFWLPYFEKVMRFSAQQFEEVVGNETDIETQMLLLIEYEQKTVLEQFKAIKKAREFPTTPVDDLIEKMKATECRGWWLALCPFHDDHHPSMYFNEQEFRCMACGKVGPIATLREALEAADTSG